MISKLTLAGILFVIIFFTPGCTDKQYPLPDHITINDSALGTRFLLSSLISTYTIIPLESNSQSTISVVDKVEEFGGKIYVLDRNIAGTIVTFDSSGKFLYRVGSTGFGLGQYQSPQDFCIAKNKNEILVLDGQRKKIIHYKLEDGRFLSEDNLDFWTTRLISFGDNFAFAGARNEDNLILTDNKFHKLFSLFPMNVKTEKKPYRSFNLVSDSLLLFDLYMTDTIYRITKDQAYPYHIIDYGNKASKLSDFTSENRILSVLSELKDKMITYKYYFENAHNIVFLFAYQNKIYIVIKSKVNHEVHICQYDNIVNDVTFGKTFPAISGIGADNSFFATVDASEALTVEPKDSSDEKYLYAKKKFGEVGKIPNPVLVKFSFR